MCVFDVWTTEKQLRWRSGVLKGVLKRCFRVFLTCHIGLKHWKWASNVSSDDAANKAIWKYFVCTKFKRAPWSLIFITQLAVIGVKVMPAYQQEGISPLQQPSNRTACCDDCYPVKEGRAKNSHFGLRKSPEIRTSGLQILGKSAGCDSQCCLNQVLTGNDGHAP